MRRPQKTRNTSFGPLCSSKRVSAIGRSSSASAMKLCSTVSTVTVPTAVATSSGLRVDSRASFRTSVGKVAEKSSVWRSSGV